MRTDYSNDTNFWDWAEVLWGCERLFTDPAKDPRPAPLGGGVIIIDMPRPLRTEESRHPHIAHDGDYDPDDTQEFPVMWEGENDVNQQ